MRRTINFPRTELLFAAAAHLLADEHLVQPAAPATPEGDQQPG